MSSPTSSDPRTGQIVTGGHGSPILAQAWLASASTSATSASGGVFTGRSNDRAIPSSPGRWVQFRSGHTVLRDERDLLTCLKLEGCTVRVERDYVDWIANTVSRLGQAPQAEIQLPEGFALEGGPGNYRLVRDVPPALAPAAPPAKVQHDPDTCQCPGCRTRRKEGRQLVEEAGRKWRPGGPGRPPKNREEAEL